MKDTNDGKTNELDTNPTSNAHKPQTIHRGNRTKPARTKIERDLKQFSVRYQRKSQQENEKYMSIYTLITNVTLDLYIFFIR